MENELFNASLNSIALYGLWSLALYVGLWRKSAVENPEYATKDHLIIAKEQFPYVFLDKLNQTAIIGLSSLPLVKVGLEYLLN